MANTPEAPDTPEALNTSPAAAKRQLTPEQRLDALRRVQAQAEHRVRLGKQLFEAAEARIKAEQQVLDQVRSEQKLLREQVNEDFARSLHQYDQWMGQIDESFTHAIQALEKKIDAVAAQQQAAVAQAEAEHNRVSELMKQVESLMSAGVETALTTKVDALAEQVETDRDRIDTILKRAEGLVSRATQIMLGKDAGFGNKGAA